MLVAHDLPAALALADTLEGGVGAAAAVSTPEADPARAPETNGRAQPRVRLETIFKF